MKEPRGRGSRSRNGTFVWGLLVVIAAVGIQCAGPPEVTQKPQHTEASEDTTDLLERMGNLRQTKARADVSSITTAVDMFKIDTARYPQSLKDISSPPPGLEDWDGPYLRDAVIPLDPWGRPYVYALDRDGFTVTSYGADGVEGGTGEDTDITGH